MLELAPAQVKKTPAYCAGIPGAQPIMARPMMVTIALPAMIGPRMRYLSASHAVENMQIPAKASVMTVSRNSLSSATVALTRWRHKALRRSNAETHSAVEDLRQKVGQSVRHSRQATETHREPPDLEIKTGLQELDKIERLRSNISSVSIDASNNEIHLASVEETPGFLRVGVGEGHEEEVAHDSDADGQDAFDDKDPPPSAQSSQTMHLH
jgi:hypothetical protein